MAANLDEATIYQIFRACRLCGAGGGYKMPIIPSVVGFDCADMQLQQKIRECVQIEVHQDDQMPPLICEMCVNKVNDFYEFMEMCQQTNQNTRQRLGLPMTFSRAESEVDCILGVTEPVYLQTSDDDQPLSRNRIVRPVKVRDDSKSDKSNRSRQEKRSSRESRSSLRDRRDSGSSNCSKRSNKVKEQDIALSQLREQQRNNERLRPPLKRESKPLVIDISDDEDSLLVPRPKKTRIEKLAVETKSLRSKPEIKTPEPKSLRSKTETSTANLEPKSLRSKIEAKAPSLETKSLRSKTETNTPSIESKSLRSKTETNTPSIESKSLRSKTTTSTPNLEKKSLRSKLETENLEPKSLRSKNETPSLEPKSLRSKPEIKTQTQDVEPKSLRSKNESKTNSEPKDIKKDKEKEYKKDKEIVEEKQAKLKTSSQSKPVPSSRPGPKSSKKIESPPPQPDKPAQSTNKSKQQKPGPKSSKRPRSPSPSPPPTSPSPPPLSCGICAQSCVSTQGLASHLRMHAVRFTPHHLACNPCGDWFLTPEETTAHHKWHKNNHVYYTCRACTTSFRQYKDYERHMTESGPNHVPWQEAPDVQCSECWRKFPTRVVMIRHQCGGATARPGGKCKKCSRHYQLHKNLVKHQATCAGKKKTIDINELNIDPEVRESLLPMRVKVVNCDPLLKGKKQRCDVTTVPLNYGFDPRSVYPYRYLVRIKREPLEFDGMVSINTEIRDEFYKEEDYVHWDSDNSSDSDMEFSTLNPEERLQKVPSLTALSLKTIYSRRCLGKVPKKLRKVKQDKFESLFNIENDFDGCRNDFDNIQSDIDNIIDNLDADKMDNYGSVDRTIDSIEISETFSLTDNFQVSTTFEATTNLEFDSLKDSLKYNENISLHTTYNYENSNTSETKSKNGDFDRTDASLDDSEKVSENCALQSNITDDTDNYSVDTGDGFITDDATDSLKNDTDTNNLLNDSAVASSNVFKDSTVDCTNVNDSAVTTTALRNDNVENTNLNKDNAENTNSYKENVSNTNLFKENTIDFSIESLLGSQSVEKNDLALESNNESDLGNNLDNITEKQNGGCATDKVINNGTDSNDLISEINDLYDKKLMDDLDAEIGL